MKQAEKPLRTGKRALMKLATQCVNDVMGRIRTADISKQERWIVVGMVSGRLFRTKIEAEWDKKKEANAARRR